MNLVRGIRQEGQEGPTSVLLQLKRSQKKEIFVNKILVCLMTLLCCSFSIAQSAIAAGADGNPDLAAAREAKLQAAQAEFHSSQATTTCSFNFSSGIDDFSLAYCVTANGNIPVLNAPSGFPLSAVEGAEGYGICDQTTGVAYSDFGGFGDTGNWLPATVVSQTPTSVRIARTTSDGIWTLTQVITQAGGSRPIVMIAMTLKNNTAVSRFAWLLRYMDTDIAGVTINTFDFTRRGAGAWNSPGVVQGSVPIGLMIENLSDPQFQQAPLVQNTFRPPAPCNPFAAVTPAPLTFLDGSIVMAYQPLVPAQGTRTATLMYRPW